MSSILFPEMEEFTLFDGLVPCSGLPDLDLAVEDQLNSGILFPGDSLVKNGIGSEELFEDFLSTGSIQDPFSEEWMETVDLSSLLDDTKYQQTPEVTTENVFVPQKASSGLLEELLTQPITIKSSPTVSNSISQNRQLETIKLNTPQSEVQSSEVEIDSTNILEEAIDELNEMDVLILNEQLHDIYKQSISSNDSIEMGSSEISLIDDSQEILLASPLSAADSNDFLTSSPLSSEDIDSVLDDSDYVPDIPEPTPTKKSSRKSGKNRKSNDNRTCPYDVPANVTKLDKKERKRVQNRNAALRYREKKRLERGGIHSEEEVLLSRNKELKRKFEHLDNEVKYMKSLLVDVCKAKGLKIKFKLS